MKVDLRLVDACPRVLSSRSSNSTLDLLLTSNENGSTLAGAAKMNGTLIHEPFGPKDTTAMKSPLPFTEKVPVIAGAE